MEPGPPEWFTRIVRGSLSMSPGLIPSIGSIIPSRWRADSALAAVCLLALAAGACSSRPKSITAPASTDHGVPVEVVAPAVNAVDFSRFVVQVVAYDWDQGRGLDASWSYDSGTGVWSR